MLVDILCPHCKSKFSVDGTNIPPQGAQVDCERCGQQFTATLPEEKSKEPRQEKPAGAAARAKRSKAPASRFAKTPGAPALAGAPAPRPVPATAGDPYAAPVAPPVAMPPVAVPGVGTLACCPGCGLRFVLASPADGALMAPAAAAGQILPVRETPAAAATPTAPPGQISPVPARSVPSPASAPAAAAQKAAAAESTAGQASGAPGKPTVLLVEDLEFYSTLVSGALGSKYRTIAVATVAAALQALREERVDVMVLDLTLKEGEDGRDILRALDEKPCPILVFSAKDESEMYGETWEELRKLGADDMLIKGMNVQESLLQKISALLGKT